MDEYVTITENGEAEIIEKKSKFIANLFYVESVYEAENLIKETKKKYYDARHNCIAYRVVEDKIVEKASDDGEPSGTAGGPMLNILQKNNLANVLVIVTRYFGGILLGTGGLVRAYSDATLKVLDNVKTVEKCRGIEILVTLEYNNLELLKYYCKNNNIDITKIEYTDKIECILEMEKGIKDRLLEDINNMKLNVIETKILHEKYINKCK